MLYFSRCFLFLILCVLTQNSSEKCKIMHKIELFCVIMVICPKMVKVENNVVGNVRRFQSALASG